MEDSLLTKLEGLEGVASVQLSGQQVEEVEFSFKKDKLKQYGLDEDTVKQVIQGSDVTTPLGLYTFGKEEKSVVVSGDIETIKDLKNMRIPAASAGGASAQAGAQSAQAAQGAQAQAGAQSAGQAQQSAGIPTVKLSDIATIKDVKKPNPFHEPMVKTASASASLKQTTPIPSR